MTISLFSEVLDIILYKYKQQTSGSVTSFASTFALEDRKTRNTGVTLKISLCLIKNNSMKVHGGLDSQLHAFLIPAPGGGYYFQALIALKPGEISPDNHWIENGVGPRACLDTVEERKISDPASNRTQFLR
jgi:hypothetical protein